MSKIRTGLVLFTVIALGGIQAAPAGALFRKKHSKRHSSHSTYDTPRTLQLKSRVLAASDQTEQLERKKDRIESQLKANKSSIKSWEQEIKSIYRAQEDEAKRIQAEKEQNDYQVGTLDFHYHESDTSAKLSDDNVRAESMADYGGYDEDFKTVVPSKNKYLISEKEYNHRYKRVKGGINYYPAARN